MWLLLHAIQRWGPTTPALRGGAAAARRGRGGRSSFSFAACSSLTELFAPTIHQRRLDNWPQIYPWIDERGYRYFRKRLSESRRDVEHGLTVSLDHFKTRSDQDYALSILQFKLNVLWTMLDAMWMAYIEHKPPFFSCPHE